MKSLTSKIVLCFVVCFAGGCSLKSKTTGYIVLNRCYKLINEHYTLNKPEILNLNTIKEWELCETNIFDHDATRIKSMPEDRTIQLILTKESLSNEYVCNYQLVVDNVGQSGQGFIIIDEKQYDFYLIDTWSLCIDISGELLGTVEDRTLEFQLWGC